MNLTIDSLLTMLRTARGHTLNLSQLITMIALRSEGPMNLTALGRITRISSAAMTGVADSLEASGFVARTGTPDRRMLHLTLTDAGHDTIAIILDALEPVPA